MLPALSPGLTQSFRRPPKHTASSQGVPARTRRCAGMALCQSATNGHAMLTAQSTTFCPEGRYRFDHTEPSRTDEPPARYMPGPRPRCGFWYPTVDQRLVSWLAYEQGKIPFQGL